MRPPVSPPKLYHLPADLHEDHDLAATVLHGVQTRLHDGDAGGLDACLGHPEGRAEGLNCLGGHQFHVWHHRKVQHDLHGEPTTVAELELGSRRAAAGVRGWEGAGWPPALQQRGRRQLRTPLQTAEGAPVTSSTTSTPEGGKFRASSGTHLGASV